MKNKYEIKMTSRFKKDLKTVRKRKCFLIEKTGKGIGRMRVIYTYQDIKLYYFNKKIKNNFFSKNIAKKITNCYNKNIKIKNKGNDYQ